MIDEPEFTGFRISGFVNRKHETPLGDPVAGFPLASSQMLCFARDDDELQAIPKWFDGQPRAGHRRFNTGHCTDGRQAGNGGPGYPDSAVAG